MAARNGLQCPVRSALSPKADDVVAGSEVGYTYQLSTGPGLVVGAAADYQFHADPRLRRPDRGLRASRPARRRLSGRRLPGRPAPGLARHGPGQDRLRLPTASCLRDRRRRLRQRAARHRDHGGGCRGVGGARVNQARFRRPEKSALRVGWVAAAAWNTPSARISRSRARPCTTIRGARTVSPGMRAACGPQSPRHPRREHERHPRPDRPQLPLRPRPAGHRPVRRCREGADRPGALRPAGRADLGLRDRHRYVYNSGSFSKGALPAGRRADGLAPDLSRRGGPFDRDLRPPRPQPDRLFAKGFSARASSPPAGRSPARRLLRARAAPPLDHAVADPGRRRS